MAIRLTKPWRDLAAREVARLTGQLGVYHVGDQAGNVLFVGVAGAARASACGASSRRSSPAEGRASGSGRRSTPSTTPAIASS